MGVRVAEGAGDASGGATGVKPGALTALLQEVAAAPEKGEAEPVSLPPGTVIGRFEIIRELGRGGFGVVYEAKDRDLGRQVAVKVVRPGRITEEEGKVSREAEAIARLAHPNLITLHEVGRSEHGPFLVFELLRGKTLDLKIEEGPLPVQEAVHIAAEVARGLAHAHAEGVIHRDLKPANVFVTNKGQVKILDFGMAHAFGRRRLSGGTPAYMAPEQWEDDPEDERTDVFALGVMLYRMLTGEYPFPEGKGKWSSEAVTIRKLDVPGAPDLAELVQKMLDRTPKGRPRDGAAVLAALTPIEERLRAKPADGSPPIHAKRRKATFGDLLAELRRRHVFRVMIGYGVFAFAVLQVTEPIMHGADLPKWVLKAVLVALVLGFPVAVILAWVFDLTAQGVKRTPSTMDPQAPRFGRSRLLLPLAVATVVLAIAAAGAGGWYAWKGASGGRHPGASVPKAGPDGRIMVAVADFANDTRDPELDGLSGLLITSLEQSQALRVLTRGRMLELLRATGRTGVEQIDEAAAREVGRQAGASALLHASIRLLGGAYVVDLRAVDPARDEYLFTLRETAAGKGDVLALVDRLSAGTRRRLRDEVAGAGDKAIPVGEAVTSNLEAYQHFFRGDQHLDALRIPQAMEEYRGALAVDPDFALAHLRIAWLGAFVGLPRAARLAAIDAAVRNIGSVPPREALFIRAMKAREDGNRAEAHALAGEAVRAFPDSKEALFFASDLLGDEGRLSEQVPLLRKAVALDPTWDPATAILLSTLILLGRFDEAEVLARARAEKAPSAMAFGALAMALVGSGRPIEAVAAARRAAALDDTPFPRFNLAEALDVADQLEEAEAILRDLAARREPFGARVDGSFRLVGAVAAQGRMQEAFDLARAIPHGPDGETDMNDWAGVLLLMCRGPSAQGRRFAAAVARSDHPTMKQFAPLQLLLQGDEVGAAAAAARLGPGTGRVQYDATLAWQRGDRERALAMLKEEARSVGRFRAGLEWQIAWYASELGRDADVIAATDALARMPSGPWRGLGYAQSLHRAAISHERRGEADKAVEKLDRLLARWRRADPDLPLLAEAKAMRARLVPASK
jgi:tetratricopeptide (TPR) repeat protein